MYWELHVYACAAQQSRERYRDIWICLGHIFVVCRFRINTLTELYPSSISDSHVCSRGKQSIQLLNGQHEPPSIARGIHNPNTNKYMCNYDVCMGVGVGVDS